MKKVYFCGSIKGGRQLVDNYALIISALKHRCEVLTEHIGDVGYAKTGFAPPEQVYEQDTQWLRQSDFVLAEVSIPSLGVGYELAYAEARGKRVYCLYQRDMQDAVSSMVLGNSNFCCIPYAVDEIEQIVNNIIDTER